MPISTRGLGMATNATQQLAQLVAALSAQKAQGIRGLGDTARQIQQDAARRKAAEVAQGQRQQGIDLQRQQFEQQNANRTADLGRQEQQRQALAQFTSQQMAPQASPQQEAMGAIPGLGELSQPQGPDLSKLGPGALQAIVGNLFRQQAAGAERDFQGEQGALGRQHDMSRLGVLEGGKDSRLGQTLGSQEGMQRTSIEEKRRAQHAEHMYRGGESARQRAFAGRESGLDRSQRGELAGKDIASREKIAGDRLKAAGQTTGDGGKSIASQIAALRKQRNDALIKAKSPAKDALGKEAPFQPENRAGLESVVAEIDKQIASLETQMKQGQLGALLKLQELRKAGKPIPEALMREAGLAK